MTAAFDAIKVIDRQPGALQNAIKWGSAPPRDPVIASWLGGNNTASGAYVTPDTAMNVSTVYACVMKISKALAIMPLITYQSDVKAGKNIRDLKNPLYNLLYCQPNPMQTSYDWTLMMQSHLLLRGNAYSYIQPGAGRGIAALIPLHPDRVRPFWVDPEKMIHAYEYRPETGETKVLLPHEVLHLRDWAPDGLTGKTRITQHRECIGFAMTLQTHGGRMFANGAQPSGALTMPGEMSDPVMERLRKQWNDRYTGASNVGKTIILEQGLKYDQIGLTNIDAQYLDSRKFERNEICSIFDVPPHMIGDLDRATFSNIEQQSLEFVIFTMLPWVRNWEQAIQRDLIYTPSTFVRFMMQGLLRGDQASRYAAYAIGRQWGWLSANDVRRLEDMDPIENGDIYFQPMNMVPAGTPPEIYLKGNNSNANQNPAANQ